MRECDKHIKFSGPKASNLLYPDKDKAVFGPSNLLKSGQTFWGSCDTQVLLASLTQIRSMYAGANILTSTTSQEESLCMRNTFISLEMKSQRTL